MSIANIVKSSLGPVGLDKMLVDDIGVGINNYKPSEESNKSNHNNNILKSEMK